MKSKLLAASMMLAALGCIVAMVLIMQQIDQTRLRLTGESPGAMNYLMQTTHNFSKLVHTLHEYRYSLANELPVEQNIADYRKSFDIVWSAFQVFELRFPGEQLQQSEVIELTENIWRFLHLHEPLMELESGISADQALNMLDQARQYSVAMHVTGTRYFVSSSIAQDTTTHQLDTLYRNFWRFAIVLLIAGTLLIWLVRRFSRQASASYDMSRQTRREMEHVVQELHTGKIESKQKDSYIVEASHDLRQPLQALIFFIESLGSHIHSEQGKESLAAVKLSAAHLNKSFNSVLDLSQLDAGKVPINKSVFELSQLLQLLQLEFKAAALAADIELTLDASGCHVISDPHLLDRILRNLIDNAINHSGASQITLACRVSDKDYATIELHDNGVGIPSAAHENIFSEYFQISNPERDKSRGFGLGLAIVERLTGLIGVELKLESSREMGTCFWLTLPLGEPRHTTDKSAQAKLLNSSSGYQGDGRLIAVIDDQPYVRASIEALLRAWNFNTISSASAVDMIQQLESRQQIPEMIIADYQLQNHLTGDVAIRDIRARLKTDIPALIVTGNTTSQVLETVRQSGFPVLQKPIAPASLLEATRQQLSLPDTTEPVA